MCLIVLCFYDLYAWLFVCGYVSVLGFLGFDCGFCFLSVYCYLDAVLFICV